ncbi:MAG: serine--tRNA ligase, partial [Acidimicrobiaceae bacterium]|nr:serine--tRNA ligase [Acidimicrobiaceae bacterium]
MIDIRLLRDDPTGVRASLIRRGVSGSQVDELIDTDRNFRESVLARDEVRAELNLLSKSVEAAYKSKEIDRANELRGKAKDLGDRLSELEQTCTTVENRRKELLLYIPNIPDDNVPDGDSDQDNVPIRYWHKDLGEVAPEDFTL